MRAETSIGPPRTLVVRFVAYGGALVSALLVALMVMVGVASAAPPSTAKPGTTHTEKSGTITFGIQPATRKGVTGKTHLVYTNVIPGTSISGYVGVINGSAIPVTLGVYAADAVNAPTGAYSLLTQSQRSIGLGAWMHLARSSVHIDPHRQAIVPYVLTVPLNASPGDHDGGVVAQLSTVKRQHGKTGKIRVNHRIGFPVFLRVNGPTYPRLSVDQLSLSYADSINPFAAGNLTVDYEVKNTGNIALAARQLLSVTSLFGTLASVEPRPVKDLLPGQTLDFSVPFRSVPPAGPVDAHVTLVSLSEPKGTTSLPTTKLVPAPPPVQIAAGTWAFPRSQLVLFVIVVMLAWILLRLRRRRTSRLERAVAAAREEGRRESEHAGKEAEEQSGDDASSAGEKPLRGRKAVGAASKREGGSTAVEARTSDDDATPTAAG